MSIRSDRELGHELQHAFEQQRVIIAFELIVIAERLIGRRLVLLDQRLLE